MGSQCFLAADPLGADLLPQQPSRSGHAGSLEGPVSTSVCWLRGGPSQYGFCEGRTADECGAPGLVLQSCPAPESKPNAPTEEVGEGLLGLSDHQQALPASSRCWVPSASVALRAGPGFLSPWV